VKPVHFVCVCLMLAGALALAQAPNRVPFINQPLFSNNAAPTGLAHPDPAKQSQIVENYGKLPLSFEANHGQTDAKVKFLSRGSGYTTAYSRSSRNCISGSCWPLEVDTRA
jgi:hypothetical protein